jgi:hypothetical protein
MWGRDTQQLIGRHVPIRKLVVAEIFLLLQLNTIVPDGCTNVAESLDVSCTASSCMCRSQKRTVFVLTA